MPTRDNNYMDDTKNNDIIDISNYIINDNDEYEDLNKDESYYVENLDELINEIKNKNFDEEQISDIVDEIFDNNLFYIYDEISKLINFNHENVLYKQLKRFNIEAIEYFYNRDIRISKYKITQILCYYIKMNFKKTLDKIIKQIIFYNIDYDINIVINKIKDTNHYKLIKYFELPIDTHINETKENEKKNYNDVELLDDPIIELLNNDEDNEAFEIYCYRNYLNLKQDWVYIDYAISNNNKKFLSLIN